MLQITRVTRHGRPLLPASDTYDLYDWYARMIAGSLAYIILFQLLGEIVAQNTTVLPTGINYAFFNPPVLWEVISLVVLIVISPLLISLFLTRKDVELEKLRIVPPLAIFIIGIAYAVVFVVGLGFFLHFGQAQYVNDGVNHMFGLAALLMLALAARPEDRLAVWILGRTAERESIYFEKLKVRSPIDEVKAKLSTPEYADNLFLKMEVEGDRNTGFIFKTQGGFDFITKIGLYVDEENKQETVLKMAFYQRAAYSLRVTRYFIEEAKRQSTYLHDVLTDRTPPMVIQELVPLSHNGHDLFVNEVIEDLRGFYVQTKKATPVSKVLIGALVGLTGFTAALYLAGLPLEAVTASGEIEVLIAAVTVMDYVRKSR
jgi:hypothetical protein